MLIILFVYCSIGCPGEDVTKDPAAITLWSIMGKVRLEAMMWVGVQSTIQTAIQMRVTHRYRCCQSDFIVLLSMWLDLTVSTMNSSENMQCRCWKITEWCLTCPIEKRLNLSIHVLITTIIKTHYTY